MRTWLLLLPLVSWALPGHAALERAELIGLAASVLRIEAPRASGGYSIGSGVAVGDDKVVTNCHVTTRREEHLCAARRRALAGHGAGRERRARSVPAHGAGPRRAGGATRQCQRPGHRPDAVGPRLHRRPGHPEQRRRGGRAAPPRRRPSHPEQQLVFLRRQRRRAVRRGRPPRRRPDLSPARRRVALLRRAGRVGAATDRSRTHFISPKQRQGAAVLASAGGCAAALSARRGDAQRIALERSGHPRARVGAPDRRRRRALAPARHGAGAARTAERSARCVRMFAAPVALARCGAQQPRRVAHAAPRPARTAPCTTANL